jgi:hypothetical protein
VLIDLGFKIIEILNEDIEEITTICWNILIALIKRGELTLAHIGYSKTQKEQSFIQKNEEFIKHKHEVSLTYQQLII